MNIPLDEVVHFDVITSDPATGAATDADSTPTFEVFEEATDTDIGVGGNLTKRTSKTGNYRGTFTASAANGFEVGKFYAVVASATVDTVVGKVTARQFRIVAAEATAGMPPVTVNDKTGFKLASDGLDSISTTAPTGVASNFREMLVQTWRRWFGKSILDADAGTLKTYAADGTTVVTTQTVAEDSTTQTIGNAS